MIRDNYLDVSRLIKNKKIFRLFLVVKRHGGVVRFVGGAVRDALKGIEGGDLDLATDLSPDELVEACTEEGLKTVAIGIKFGTVGVIIDDSLLEVTSLRRDVKTDGRHAEVEFTDNWEEDASRRDLTINAVYADEKGNVFDYYNGIEDLEKGCVRFIGSASQRIKEDYLRILRFFRFYSRFGIGEPDKKALAACIENREGLKTLSMERIKEELFKLLLTPKAAATIRIMQDNGILSYIMPEAKAIDNFEFIKNLLNDKDVPDKELHYLFALYQPDESLAENLATRMKFSKREKQKFVSWATSGVTLAELSNKLSIQKIMYENDKEFCAEIFLQNVARNKENIPDFWKKYLDIKATPEPEFPVRGKDIIERGIADRQAIGFVLRELEAQWLDSNFTLSKDELLENARLLNKVS
ncbi:MAG: CCA tRNA nucleotidyltransferase [Alphaproteobacteria bacterium]|nr:CCA tRNA nucleotidyltransferase [Alphaproteobacteria bacterium]